MTQLGIFHSAPDDSPKRRRFRQALLAFAATSLFLLGQFWMQGEQLVTGPANDFLLTYGAASVLDSADIHALDGLAYRRTPLTAMAAVPLTWLPYANAYWIWLLAGMWSAVAFIVLWRPASPGWTLIAAACSAPLFVGFLEGRETPFLLLGLALAATWARAEKPFRAGLALTICLLQWQLLLFVPLLLAVQRRGRMLGGLVAGAVAACAVTVAATGADWPLRMLDAWEAFPADPGTTPTLAAALTGAPYALEIRWVVAFAAAALIWAAGRKTNLEFGLATALATGLLLSPRAELADAVVLLPAALAAASDARIGGLRLLGLILLTPAPYLLGGVQHTAQVLAAAVLAFLGLTALELLGQPSEAGERNQTQTPSPSPQAG